MHEVHCFLKDRSVDATSCHLFFISAVEELLHQFSWSHFHHPGSRRILSCIVWYWTLSEEPGKHLKLSMLLEINVEFPQAYVAFLLTTLLLYKYLMFWCIGLELRARIVYFASKDVLVVQNFRTPRRLDQETNFTPGCMLVRSNFVQEWLSSSALIF